jgi:phosphoserine aminotransferase
MTASAAKPDLRPQSPNFSSGPCAKRPGWSLDALKDAPLGRSHRAKIGKSKLEQAINLTREVLQVPADYRIGIVPASDTGAVEMALWSLLGARGVDMVAWESFGAGWVTDVVKQLKLADVRTIRGRLRRSAGSRAGRFRPRRRVHLEWHDIGRARAQR